ncbi:MAG: Rrf2 family transcriptional regulator [Acidobacteriota bacterium]
MISRTSRYALKILGYLADHPGEWIQGAQIAKATSIPSNYLSKILNQLRKRDFVVSQKGWGGGFQLKKRAARVPLLGVLEVFDGRKDDGECVFGLDRCDKEDPCPLHEHWSVIREAQREMMRSLSVADLGSGLRARPSRR